MTKDYVFVEGKTFDEAVEKGLKELGEAIENIEIEVIEEGKSILNISVKNFKIKMKKKEIRNHLVMDVTSTHENGHYELKLDQQCNYLLIYPPKGKGKPVSVEEVKTFLNNNGFFEYNAEEINKGITANEIYSIALVAPGNEKCTDAQALIEVSKDQMKAYVTIIPPQGGRMLTKKDIEDALSAATVIFGVDSIAIENALIQSCFNTKFQAAQGREPVHGLDGTVQYHFDKNVQVKPKILEDGSVNLKELNLIQNVNKGELLATKTLPSEGIEGCTVKGNKVPSKSGKPAQFKKGKNVVESPDGLQLFAGVSGQVKIIDDKVAVLQVYEVNGNVDNATGNITFNGKVVVRGNIATGFEINCEDDVEVFGVVEGATINTQGSIILHKGIQGNNSGKLFSKQDIIARYMENCYAKAHGNIQTEVAMHCKLESKGQIIVTGRKGLIVGGEARANHEISARTIGSHMATATKLEVGIDPEIKERYDSLKDEIEILHKNLDSVDKAIELLSKMSKISTLPPDKQEILIKSTNTKEYLQKKIESVNQEFMNIKQILQSLSNGRINVENVIYPGVKIFIGNSFYYVRDQIQRTTIVRDSGEIKIIPYMG